MKIKIKFITILIFVFVSCIFLTLQGNTQTKSETAGQKFKSIKVLQEMPADQMGKVMNMMSASLGVNCKFCHARNDGDYEKEGIEKKDAARRMLKMTFEMNKNYFEGRPEINCNSCHQGKPHPRPAINLSSVPSSLENAFSEASAFPEIKPSVERILAKYENALGGRANLEKITSRRIKARRVEPDGKTFEEEEIWQKGSKMLIKTVYPSRQYGDYVVREAFDGNRAWKSGNGAEIKLKPDEIEQIRREAEIFANPDLKAIYPKMEFQFIDRIDGREVWLIFATDSSGARESLYFDAQTGLLVRRVASTPTVLGAFQFQADYTDYKDFGGVRLPTVVKFAVPNIRWTRNVLEVKNNVSIEDENFNLPK